MKKTYKLPSSLPPAIPYDEDKLPDTHVPWIETPETCTAFEDRDRAIVAHFRRSHKYNLRGQVKIDV